VTEVPGEGSRKTFPGSNWEHRQPMGIGLASIDPSSPEAIEFAFDGLGWFVHCALSGTRSVCKRLEASQYPQGPSLEAGPLPWGPDPEVGPQGPIGERTPLDGARLRGRFG
jgi:hypothetical protein